MGSLVLLSIAEMTVFSAGTRKNVSRFDTLQPAAKPNCGEPRSTTAARFSADPRPDSISEGLIIPELCAYAAPTTLTEHDDCGGY